MNSPVSGKTTRDITVTNSRGEILEQKTDAFIDGVWYTIARETMTYNLQGKRITSENLAGQVTTTAWDQFACAPVGELVSAAKSAKHACDFDDIGNRESSSERGTNSVCAANQLNQYTEISSSALSASPRETFTPQFDDDGNQTLIKTATGIWSVTYNGENRPILWTSGDNTIYMSFDRMGRRVTKNAQRFVYDGYLQIAGNADNAYIWDCTESVATRPLAWMRGNSAAYYTHDGNKNVSEVIASDGAMGAHYEYEPFGAITVQSGASSVANPWRFSSEHGDDNLGLLYYNYRHYDPVVGRWGCPDPLYESMLGYAFCQNNGLRFIDLLGLQSITGYTDWNAYGALMKIAEPSPSVFDQMFGSYDNHDRGYEDYFDTRYHNTMEWYRNNIRFLIKREVDCKRSVILPKDHSYQVYGGTVKLPFQDNFDGGAINDRQQGWWERNITLGTFTIDVDPVRVTYLTDCTNGKRSYVWETNMFVVDTVGFKPGDKVPWQLFYCAPVMPRVSMLIVDMFLAYNGNYPLSESFWWWIFPDARLIMARWPLSGEGECSCCDD